MITTETTGIQCRFLVETSSGHLIRCNRQTPNIHMDVCSRHVGKIMQQVRAAAGDGSATVFREAMKVTS